MPLRLRLLPVALVAFVAIGCGGSEPSGDATDVAWGVQVRPLPVPALGRSDSPQLTASSHGVILSWIEHTDALATLRFAQRTASGWSAPRTVAAGSDWFLSWADVPAVMRLSSGTLVAHWYPATDASIEAYDIRLAHSLDQGQTWSRPFSPHTDGTTTQHGFASPFELPDRSLGLVWLDGREQARNQGGREEGTVGLYFASFDAAWKQTAETSVNTPVCECCPTSVAVTADGVVAAFRDRSPREVRDIHVTRLENGAWTPARPLHVDNWAIEACPVNGPALSASGRQVAAAWFTAVGDMPKAFAAFSSDGGRTWGEPIRLDGGSTLGHVDIELLDDGSAVASWMDFANQRSTFQMRRVEPSGTRSEAVVVTPARVTGSPRMARSGKDLVFAWTEAGDNADTPEQVRGAIAQLP